MFPVILIKSYVEQLKEELLQGKKLPLANGGETSSCSLFRAQIHSDYASDFRSEVMHPLLLKVVMEEWTIGGISKMKGSVDYFNVEKFLS